MQSKIKTPTENYGKTALEIINQSTILSKEDLNTISDLKDELVDTFLYSQMFRTRTEMEISVLSDMKFPTPDAKYWQSQREQNVHFHELVMLSYEYRKNLVEIKKIKRELEKETDDLERELKQIEIEKLTFISRNQERVAKDRIREIKEWHSIKERLIPKMNYSLKDCDEHQLLSYTKRFINQSLNIPNGASIPEKNNLLSQVHMGIKTCIEKGLIEKVLQDFHPKVRREIAKNYGLDENRFLKGARE
jgi:hypothetical protein